MSTAQNPTFFLAPNWHFPPSGRIAIGNIIRDPLQPHRPLSKPDTTRETDSVLDTNWRLSVGTAININVSVWATFLEKIKLGAEVSRGRLHSGNYTMRELETVCMKSDPTDDEIRLRCNEASVREFMRVDSVLRHPVYMVSGIKIARGFALKAQVGMRTGGALGLGGEVAPVAWLEAEAQASNERSVSNEFEAGNDIVFAYELLKIKPKGWGGEVEFEVKEYRNRKAFLSEEERVPDEGVEGEMDVVGPEDLKDAHVVNLPGVCIAYDDETDDETAK